MATMIRTPIYHDRKVQAPSTTEPTATTANLPGLGVFALANDHLLVKPARFLEVYETTPSDAEAQNIYRMILEAQEKEAVEQRVEDAEPPAREKDRDGYITKVLKYVPVELSAVFIGLVALTKATQQVETTGNVGQVRAWVLDPYFLDASFRITPVVAIVWLGILLTPLLAWSSSLRLPDKERPEWWFYLLAPLAFIVWIMALDEDARLALDRGKATSELLLALGAFLIPAIDELATALFVKDTVPESPVPEEQPPA